MLKGIDISHWQSALNLNALTPRPDFVIIKATEGVNIVDAMCDKFFQQAKQLGLSIGFYHFARPSKNSAESEAEYFVKNCKGYFNQAIPVLDWEDSVKSPAWAKQWLDKVYALTGVRPLIYMSSSVVNGNDWSQVASLYGLWVANYGINDGQPHTRPSVKYWQTTALWQYTSQGRVQGYDSVLDLDYFYGDKTAWGLYAGIKNQEETVMVQVENSKFEELVTKSTHYDEMANAGFNSLQKINSALENLRAENNALRDKLESNEIISQDVSLNLTINGQRFKLNDITVDAAGRLNPHYVIV